MKLRLADVARSWQTSGVSVIPILANQTKRPAIRWAEYQVQAPTLGEVDQWWGNGKTYGLALICGAVSGNLEMTEIEGRACFGESMTEIMNKMDELGVGEIWDLLTGPNGYSEMSPSGGLHLLYRISDHEVPGNTKLAQGADKAVLAETRGEGGYVIVAPTPGVCHPSGEAWAILQGAYGTLPVITWEQRCALHAALAAALHDESAHAKTEPDRTVPPSDYPSLSGPALALSDGPVHSVTGPTNTSSDYSRLPKSVRDTTDHAHSDTARQANADHAHPDYPASAPVHSAPYDSSDQATPWSPPTSLTPAALPSVTSHSATGLSAAGLSPGDHFESVTDWSEILEPTGWSLSHRTGPTRYWVRPGKSPRDGHSATTGHADDRDRLYVFSTSTDFEAEQSYTKFAAYAILNFGGNYQMAAADLMRKGYGQRPGQELDTISLGKPPMPEVEYEFSDKGNARRLLARVWGRYHYLNEEKTIIFWDGKQWHPDKSSSLHHEFNLMVDEEKEKAQRNGDEEALKYWKRCGNMPRVTGCLAQLMSEPGYQIPVDTLNQDRFLLNLDNGIYDLKTHELRPHDRELLMTRTMGAAYQNEATCPRFEGFMERVVPDPDMRSYVQRALGYTMLGDADQRSLFLICGPSGTGKSTLMSTMELLFKGYGATAPPGTLRATGKDSSTPSNDLHTLMGKRFVSTSETNEHTAYNEDLIKRLTGRDTISSRKLYQEFQEWSPRCSIWLATNHPPRFSSDDDAIWRRAKIVPFNTVLLDENEVSDYAHNVLALELNGILNWLLDGLKAYQEQGLQEPGSVKEQAREVRLLSDPVSRFLEDRVMDGVLLRGEGNQIRSTELYSMYTEWAKVVGERSLGSRRFTNRISSAFPDLDNAKVGGYYVWRGLGKATVVPGNWIMGSQAP